MYSKALVFLYSGIALDWEIKALLRVEGPDPLPSFLVPPVAKTLRSISLINPELATASAAGPLLAATLIITALAVGYLATGLTESFFAALIRRKINPVKAGCGSCCGSGSKS